MPALRTVRKLAMLAAWLPAALGAQTNLQFGQGDPLNPPPGWFVLDATPDAEYRAEWHANCRGDAPCAVLAGPATATAGDLGSFLQDFDAAPFRGKRVKLRAWIKMEAGALGDKAHLLLQVNRPNAGVLFPDAMEDRPIVSSEWKSYEIRGEVAGNAATIRIGVALYGRGRAWVSGVEFAEDAIAPAQLAEVREAIQKQYALLDAAFTRGDENEVAKVVLPDAQMGVGSVREPLLPAIRGEMQKGARLAARTKVVSAQLDGDDAEVMVEREAADPNPGGKRRVVTTHRDTWSLVAGAWRWKESIELAYHWVLPPTTVSVVRIVAAELRAHARPLQTGQAGEEWANLEAFGAAVGESRIVALGEAARGTREFTGLKQRLVEYLVRDKGFTVLVAINPEDAAGASEWLSSNAPEAAFVAFSSSDARDMADRFSSLLDTTYPKAKVILWTDNGHARFGDEMAEKSMGEWLRERYGRSFYVAGFAFRRGEVRAVGVDNGDSKGLGMWKVPPSPEGSGDAVLSAAGMPAFFLDVASLPASGTLARWLTDAHLFHDLGAYWVVQDPDASLLPAEVRKRYDGLFFVEELHGGG
ncbi:MAG: erythromycin esterase family protein [Bryobacteraceae bacterium]|jgi:hypothetical protein